MSKLTETIRNAAEKSKQSIDQIEKELVSYLDKKYSNDTDDVFNQKIDRIVKKGKDRIIATLYNSTECKISEGWRNLSVIPSYHTLLWWALGQDPVFQGELFTRLVDELLADGIIYTHTFPGDKEPKEVGLTEKGKLYWAVKNVD